MLKPIINTLQLLDIKIGNYLEKRNYFKQKYYKAGRQSLWNEISPAWFRYHNGIETPRQFALQVHELMNKVMNE